MAMTQTMRVISKKHSNTEVVINCEDFDPSIHSEINKLKLEEPKQSKKKIDKKE